MTTDRILVPVDFSDGSKLSLRYAGALARRTGARLVPFHAVDTPTHLFAEYEFGLHDVGAMHERLMGTARERMDVLLHSQEFEGSEAPDVRVCIGLAPEQIRREALDSHCSMVVMSTHGRAGLARMLMGSVTEKVIRSCPVPVISLGFAASGEEVRFDAHSRADRALELARILVPTDLSPTSLAALVPAARLAERFQAELDLVHVIAEMGSNPAIFWDQIPGVSIDEFREHAEQHATRYLRSTIEQHLPAANWVNYRVLRGTAHIELVRHAREVPYDMIVMATHGRSGLERAVLGSTAENVVRSAPCPVMTVRGDASADLTEEPAPG